MAASQDECDLGELICDRTPYKGMAMPAGWKNQIEWDQQVSQWSFRGQSHRIAKALRVPVLITDEKGDTYLDWLIVGYEGHGP